MKGNEGNGPVLSGTINSELGNAKIMYSRPSQYRRSWGEKPAVFRNGRIGREFNL